MGLIYSTFCMISFCFERVLTWACCACALMTLLSAIMLLMVYGVSIGYGYAQQELAAFAKKSREHFNENIWLRDPSRNPTFVQTPMRRRRRSERNDSATDYQPSGLPAPKNRSPMERSNRWHEVHHDRNNRGSGVPRKAPDGPKAPAVPPGIQEDPETPYGREASYALKGSYARVAPYAQVTRDIQETTYSREAPYFREANYARKASDAQEAPVQEAVDAQDAPLQEAVDAREAPDSQEALDTRDAPYAQEIPYPGAGDAREAPEAREASEARETPDAREAPIVQEILHASETDSRETLDTREVPEAVQSPIIILPTESPPQEPEMLLPHEKELARKIIGRFRRSKVSKRLTV